MNNLTYQMQQRLDNWRSNINKVPTAAKIRPRSLLGDMKQTYMLQRREYVDLQQEHKRSQEQK